jgi:hypothetical protein
MKAPRLFLMIVAIALAVGIGPALTDAADMTAASLSKAVDALEAATGGKVLEILYPLEQWDTDTRTRIADAVKGAMAQERTILASSSRK